MHSMTLEWNGLRSNFIWRQYSPQRISRWVSASTFANALGFQGCQIASSYAACASGVTALSIARSQILAGICEVALVVGADQVAKGMFAPVPGDRPNDVDWLRFRLMGYPIQRISGCSQGEEWLSTVTQDDFAAVKVKIQNMGQVIQTLDMQKYSPLTM